MEEITTRICVIGGGRWGQNHIRTLQGLGVLAGMVEPCAERLAALLAQYPGVEGFASVEEALARGFDGYTLATPAETHYPVARAIVERGGSVMVEKPMTLNAHQALALTQLARQTGAQVMVGHVLLFHPAIRKIKALVDGGRIGKLYYMYSNRLNLGTVRTEESVFASFAPHDISVLDYLAGAPALEVRSCGSKYLQQTVFDTTLTHLRYPGNVGGHIFVSWLHPFKQQLLVVVGSEGMISFDDASPRKEIKLYHKKVDFENGVPVKVEKPDEVVPYPPLQPLTEELRYFVDRVRDRGPIEVNSALDGYHVVQVLDKVQAQLEAQ